MEDQRPQTQVLRWQYLSSAALDLLQKCERDWNSAEVGVRASIHLKARISFSSSPTSSV